MDSYDIETAGLAEREFIASPLTDPLFRAVIVCMERNSSLYHQTLKGIAKHIHDPKFYERGDSWFKEWSGAKEIKNEKVRALRRLSGWFGLLADAFEYVEERKESPPL